MAFYSSYKSCMSLLLVAEFSLKISISNLGGVVLQKVMAVMP